MSTRSTAAFNASRAGGNSKTSVVRFVTAYLDRRDEFVTGIHPHPISLHGRAPLWDRQASLFAEVSR